MSAEEPTKDLIIDFGDSSPKPKGRWVQKLGHVKDKFRARRQTDSHLMDLKKDRDTSPDDNISDCGLMRELGRRSVMWSLLLALLRCFGMRY